MNESTCKLLDKTDRSIAAGESALADGHVEAAANRAYYAMFYVAEALLNERGLYFRKHGGVHGAFGEHFAKTGCLILGTIAVCWRPSTSALPPITAWMRN